MFMVGYIIDLVIDMAVLYLTLLLEKLFMLIFNYLYTPLKSQRESSISANSIIAVGCFGSIRRLLEDFQDPVKHH
jgi:hypothetical protein